MNKLRFSLFLIVVFTLIFATQVVFAADIGPKPTMEFDFQQDASVGKVSITSGILYECNQADCSDAAPLEELGPQRFTCEEFHCSALAYGFAPYHRIELQFSDGKTRQSNIFETINFDSNYRVIVHENDLTVETVSGSPAPTEEAFSLLTPSPIASPEESDFAPNFLIGLGGLCCLGLVFLLFVGLVVLFNSNSRTK
ncbi:MAG: hypothetical protein QM730_08495 [Anaerolineales bacterium]